MMQKIHCNGLEFCITEAGNGPPLLYLTGTNSDMRQSPTPVESPLTEDFRVLLFDQRGMGLGPKPMEPWAMEDYANDAMAVLDTLGVTQCHVVGYSFGGMVAQELAIRAPGRIGALVLAATTAGGAGGSSFALHELSMLEPFERAKQELQISDLAFTSEWQKANPEAARERIALRVKKQQEFIEDEGMRTGRNHQLTARATHDTWDRLDQITAPTLVLCGSRDGQAPLDASRRMASRIRHSELRVLEGSHGFINEQPVGFAAITTFLKQHPVGRLT